MRKIRGNKFTPGRALHVSKARYRGFSKNKWILGKGWIFYKGWISNQMNFIKGRNLRDEFAGKMNYEFTRQNKI